MAPLVLVPGAAVQGVAVAVVSAIQNWCNSNGHQTAGVQWEIYGDPDESDHVDIEVCYLPILIAPPTCRG